MSKFPDLDDADSVLSGVRLGWGIAETRGRNRPDGPLGDGARMPDRNDHALPLRIERSPTELRILAQSLVAAQAKDLHVDESEDGASWSAALDDAARLLYHVRAPKAGQALRDALELLEPVRAQDGGSASATEATQAALDRLRTGLAAQAAVMARRRQAVAAAKQALADAQQQAAGLAAGAATATARAVADAEAALRLEQAASTGERRGLAALRQVIGTLTTVATSPGPAAQAIVDAIAARLKDIADAAHGPWEVLAELIWRFDAHIQDGVAAASETRAIGYQLGRGLAETYWALGPGQLGHGSTSWSFLLGDERCGELSRLVGRLAAYMNDYTAPAIASSVDVWKEVARNDKWRGTPDVADAALYRQIRRWYELIVLGQDPTTLIKPGDIFRNFRTLPRVLKFFWPQLLALLIALAAVVALIVFLAIDGTTLQKTFSGVLAGVGLTLASLTGTLKNSGQALLKRLRQDAYTDLVAFAVQTAPTPPRKSDIRKAIAQRDLTPATPN